MDGMLQMLHKGSKGLRTVGEILITPASVLPLAGLLIMAGDLLGRAGLGFAAILTSTGSILLTQFPLLAAICLAYGLANGRPGAAALSGALSYLVLNQAGDVVYKLLAGSAALPPFSMGLLAGLVAGLITAVCHNRLRSLKLPNWLMFFEGCRMSAILSLVISLLVGVACGALWSVIRDGLLAAADNFARVGAGGAFAYGFLNRLLLPFGLHHVLNQQIWFSFGDFTSQAGQLVTGDVNRFLAGDPTAGRLVSGFYPMMVFGLPAIALCFTLTARLHNRSRLILLMAITAGVSLVSGITEPLEYLMLFVSPLLYVLYSLLFGLSLLISYQLQVLFGFSFSTGLTDLLANWQRATNPDGIWQVGIMMAILSFAAAYFAVTMLKLHAPGHDRPEAEDLQETKP
jgi:N-acetylglucosamine PTS system EIICBA or EIICB component